MRIDIIHNAGVFTGDTDLNPPDHICDSASAVGYAFKAWLLCLPSTTFILANLIEAQGFTGGQPSLDLAHELWKWARLHNIIASSSPMICLPGLLHGKVPDLILGQQDQAQIWLTRHTRAV